MFKEQADCMKLSSRHTVQCISDHIDSKCSYQSNVSCNCNEPGFEGHRRQLVNLTKMVPICLSQASAIHSLLERAAPVSGTSKTAKSCSAR